MSTSKSEVHAAQVKAHAAAFMRHIDPYADFVAAFRMLSESSEKSSETRAAVRMVHDWVWRAAADKNGALSKRISPLIPNPLFGSPLATLMLVGAYLRADNAIKKQNALGKLEAALENPRTLKVRIASVLRNLEPDFFEATLRHSASSLEQNPVFKEQFSEAQIAVEKIGPHVPDLAMSAAAAPASTLVERALPSGGDTPPSDSGLPPPEPGYQTSVAAESPFRIGFSTGQPA